MRCLANRPRVDFQQLAETCDAKSREVLLTSLQRYAAAHTAEPPELLERLERETLDSRPDSQMLTGRCEGQFLRLLVRLAPSVHHPEK